MEQPCKENLGLAAKNFEKTENQKNLQELENLIESQNILRIFQNCISGSSSKIFNGFSKR